MTGAKYFIAGGAGFLGSHFCDHLLARRETEAVTVYDNFSSGREWHLAHHQKDARLKIIRADIHETQKLEEGMRGHDVVIHLASNPDIAAAVSDPDIDFREGTMLTRNVVEAMRKSGAKDLLYASGSGVYGEIGEVEGREDGGPYIPVSTYGASKLSGEVLIASYCYMFGLRGRCFRLGNAVGPRQTHGVGYDFARRLLKDPSRLRILGDGSQSKSYIHCDDIIRAVLLAAKETKEPFRAYNVATGDYITVKEIADIAVRAVGLKPGSVKYEFTGGDRGWKGDVPVVRLNTDRIRALGWRCERNAAQAIEASIGSLLQDIRAGRIPNP